MIQFSHSNRRQVEAGDDRILGFAMIGAEAGEGAVVVQTAMLAGMPYTGLHEQIARRAPAFTPGVQSAFGSRCTVEGSQ